jgi:IclR family transcriptional regulator, acetate operon repressor
MDSRKRLSAFARPSPVPLVRLDEVAGTAPTLKPFTFLEAITKAERPLSVSELSALLDVPQPTAHRIVHMLEAEGLLERDVGSRRYGPAARLVALGLGIVTTAVRGAPRRAILEALSADVGETCNFGVVAGNHVKYLDRVEAAWPFGLRFEPGSLVPLHCTSMGKLFLSYLRAEQRRQLLTAAPLHRYTEHTIDDPVQLEAELEQIRAAEVSTDNQEFLAGVVCVAVPVRARSAALAAAVALSAPVARLSLKRALEFVPRLRSAAEQISATFDNLTDGPATAECKRKA